MCIRDRFKITGYARKTNSDYDSWDDGAAIASNIMYAFQSGIERKENNVDDSLVAHVHVHDRYYDTAVKNKYYSRSYTLKGERKINVSDEISFGFGSDYNYNKGEFNVHGSWGSYARGHSDNLGLFTNFGYKFNENTIFSSHLRGDKHLSLIHI